MSKPASGNAVLIRSVTAAGEAVVGSLMTWVAGAAPGCVTYTVLPRGGASPSIARRLATFTKVELRKLRAGGEIIASG